MILTTNEAAACLSTANAIKGFVKVSMGHRSVAFHEGGTVTVFDGLTGDNERFDNKAEFATRYEVAS